MIPPFKNLGRKYKAITIKAITATTSQAITLKPSLKAAPFKPTICSVDRFVSSKEPAIIGNVSERPPRKNPSELDFSSSLVINQVSSAAKIVKLIKEIKIQVVIGNFRETEKIKLKVSSGNTVNALRVHRSLL